MLICTLLLSENVQPTMDTPSVGSRGTELSIVSSNENMSSENKVVVGTNTNIPQSLESVNHNNDSSGANAVNNRSSNNEC